MWRNLTNNALVLVGTILVSLGLAYLLIECLMVVLFGLTYSDAARLFQSVGTVTAIMVGGIFAYWRLQLFRTFEPHLTVTHDISHRQVGESYLHIAVTSRLHNSSKVKIELRKASFSIQMVSPITDEVVLSLYEDTFVDGNRRDLDWTNLEEIERTWAKDELFIEPNESHQETCEFIIQSEVTSALIYTYFYNSEKSKNARSASGWSATSMCDFVDVIASPADS